MVKIHFLGTAGGNASPTKGFPLIAVTHQKGVFLLEMGENTTPTLLKAGYDLNAIRTAFISHMHLDHCLGIPSFLLKKGLSTVPSVTDIYFPCGALQVLQGMLLTYPRRLLDRLPLRAHEVQDQQSFITTEGLSITPFLLPHDPNGSPHLNMGYRIEVEGKILSYTGDTSGSQNLIELASGADVLISEATFANEKDELAQKVGHLTAERVAKYAMQAKVKHLVLTHCELEPGKDGLILEQARTLFKGDSMLAHDGTLIEL